MWDTVEYISFQLLTSLGWFCPLALFRNIVLNLQWIAFDQNLYQQQEYSTGKF